MLLGAKHKLCKSVSDSLRFLSLLHKSELIKVSRLITPLRSLDYKPLLLKWVIYLFTYLSIYIIYYDFLITGLNSKLCIYNNSQVQLFLFCLCMKFYNRDSQLKSTKTKKNFHGPATRKASHKPKILPRVRRIKCRSRIFVNPAGSRLQTALIHCPTMATFSHIFRFLDVLI